MSPAIQTMCVFATLVGIVLMFHMCMNKESYGSFTGLRVGKYLVNRSYMYDYQKLLNSLKFGLDCNEPVVVLWRIVKIVDDQMMIEPVPYNEASIETAKSFNQKLIIRKGQVGRYSYDDYQLSEIKPMI